MTTLRCRRVIFLTALLAATGAQGVALAPRGTGSVLLFPFYTVDGGQQTLLTVVNPTDRARALRVRFAEARNGKTVQSLNVYLAANDAWTAAVFAPAATGAAQLVSQDRSCTLDPPAIRRVPGSVSTFSSASYTGANRDWEPATTPFARAEALAAPERTRSGYVEVIEMGRLRAGNGPLELADEIHPNIVFGCAVVEAAWRNDSPAGWRNDPTQSIDLPGGGLFGHAAVVDVGDGTMVAYAATALDDFYTLASDPGALHTSPDSPRPALDDARNGPGLVRVRVSLAGAAPVVETFPATLAIDAVSLALMQSRVFGDFNADPAIAADSEWVVAFPTKAFYTDVAADAAVRAPFTDAFRDDGSADDEALFGFVDRNGLRADFTCIDCSPPPPLPLASLANAVNVVAWGLQSTPPATTPVLAAPVGAVAIAIYTGDYNGNSFRNGWASLAFEDPTTVRLDNVLTGPTTGTVYRGLPAIGFAATRFINANVQPGVLANFGDAVPLNGQLLGEGASQ